MFLSRPPSVKKRCGLHSAGKLPKVAFPLRETLPTMREALPKSQINAAPPRIFAEGPSFVLTVLVALGFACWDVPLVWSSSAASAVLSRLRPYVLGMRFLLSWGVRRCCRCCGQREGRSMERRRKSKQEGETSVQYLASSKCSLIRGRIANPGGRHDEKGNLQNGCATAIFRVSKVFLPMRLPWPKKQL